MIVSNTHPSRLFNDNKLLSHLTSIINLKTTNYLTEKENPLSQLPTFKTGLGV